MATQDYSVFEPEIWSPRVTEFFKENLVAGRLFSDFSNEVAGGGDTVHIPNIGDNFTASDVNVTSGDVTAENITDTKTSLVVDQWKATALHFSDFQLAQVARFYNLRQRYARQMAHTIARKFDTDLLATVRDNVDTTLGDSATDLTSTNLEQAFSILHSNSVPRSELSLVIHPRAYWGDIFKRQKYYDASQFGISSLPNGQVDMLYGTPVLVSENISVSSGALSNVLVHPEALAFAVGNLDGGAPMGARLSEKQGESLRIKVITDMMYGRKVLRSSAGVLLQTNNNR